jgi:hypothetical protein
MSAAGTAGMGASGASANSSVGGSGVGGAANAELSTTAMLSTVDTPAKAQALCGMLESRLDKTRYDRMVSGLCAVEGQLAAAQGTTTCQVAAASCVNERDSATGPKQDCVPDDFPQCDAVTVEEFIQCTDALIRASADYFGSFTCDSDLSSITDEFTTPSACVGPYQRCPAMAGDEAW